MQVHRVTLLIVDFDGVGFEGVKGVLENTRYPNHCIAPDVIKIESKEIGEWRDDHPLNHRETKEAEIERLFGKGVS